MVRTNVLVLFQCYYFFIQVVSTRLAPMWMLTPRQGPPGLVYHLLADRPYDVGRKDNDILITNDKSISRKHATLTVQVDEAGGSTLLVTGAIVTSRCPAARCSPQMEIARMVPPSTT